MAQITAFQSAFPAGKPARLGVTTRFLHDNINLVAGAAGVPEEQHSGTNTLLRRHVHGPGTDEPIVTYEGTTS